MTQKNYTHIAAIIDRSGSMVCIAQPTVDGFNEFLKGQKAVPGRCTMTITQFDHEIVSTLMTDIAEVPPLVLGETYKPRGNTALLDAIGTAITKLGALFAAQEESRRPSKIIIVIQTDGQENASREYTRTQIFDMITHQREKYAWEFLFLGANQDAIQEAGAMGIPLGGALTYATNAMATGASYDAVLRSVTTSRVTGASIGTSANSFTVDERTKANEGGAP